MDFVLFAVIIFFYAIYGKRHAWNGKTDDNKSKKKKMVLVFKNNMEYQFCFFMDNNISCYGIIVLHC